MPTSTLKDRWTKLDGNRSALLKRARDCAALTIPTVCPPIGYNESSTRLNTPYQSLGARGVNNLTSKLVLTLLPVNTSLFRYRIDEDVMAQIAQREAVEDAMRRYENKISLKIETLNLRPIVSQAVKHLIVTGNALLVLPKGSNPRMFGLTDYCVVRDPDGTVLEIVIKECTTESSLSPEVRDVHCKAKDQTCADDGDETVEIYTGVKLVDDKYEWHQEINGIEVADSHGRSDKDTSPYIPLRWQSVHGDNYGIGLIEEYLGDLISHEGLTKAVVQFSAAASKIVFLLHPNATTDEDALAEAESGEFVTGRKEDIDVLQLEKYADFQVAKAVLDDLTLRLSHAFLLQSGTTRNAERVTAEEIRAQAQELEDALGGVYTVLATELQLSIVKRLMSLLIASGDLPVFPKIKGQPSVVPQIVTGFEALGRTHELNRLRAYWQDLIGILGQQAMAMVNPQAIAQSLATAHNVDISTLFKSPEQMQKEAQAQQMSDLAQRAAAPVSGALAKGAVGAMTPTNS